MIKYPIPTPTMTRKRMDGTKAYVLGASIIDLIGILANENFTPGMMPLPIMVKTIPKTICNEPTAQNHGPNLVQFFLVKKVMYAV